jgi:biotin-[acetyl-CoA-carboxylase] ligase BirA-like protein
VAQTPYLPFNQEALVRSLPRRRRLAREVFVIDRASSTNILLREKIGRRLSPILALEAAQLSCDGLLMVAEEQVLGRGRRQQPWWSGPPRANLCASLAFLPAVTPPETLGLHAACALAEVMRPYCGNRTIALKWPNDLLIDGAKIAGFMVEVSEIKQLSYAILGLGINVNEAPPAAIAPYPTTCLADMADLAEMAEMADFDEPEPGQVGPKQDSRPISRDRLLAGWLWALERRLAQVAHCGNQILERDFLKLLRAWAPHGVCEPGSESGGPLLEFSVQRGLTWLVEGSSVTRPLGWIPSLSRLPAPDRR